MFRVALLILVSGCHLTGQTTDDRSKHFNLKKGIAAEGYDVVSYFTGIPLKGDKSKSYTHEGVTYLFANDINLSLFSASPEKYEPQYGGWCAYAIGDSGEKVKINPESFKITDGKLYLFYDFGDINTLALWNEREKSLQKEADINWKNMISP